MTEQNIRTMQAKELKKLARAANKKVKCIKSLFKSTYKKNAFNEKKEYFIVEDTDKFYYILDENNHPFNFAKENHGVFCFFDDYFEMI